MVLYSLGIALLPQNELPDSVSFIIVSTDLVAHWKLHNLLCVWTLHTNLFLRHYYVVVIVFSDSSTRY